VTEFLVAPVSNGSPEHKIVFWNFAVFDRFYLVSRSTSSVGVISKKLHRFVPQKMRFLPIYSQRW